MPSIPHLNIPFVPIIVSMAQNIYAKVGITMWQRKKERFKKKKKYKFNTQSSNGSTWTCTSKHMVNPLLLPKLSHRAWLVAMNEITVAPLTLKTTREHPYTWGLETSRPQRKTYKYRTNKSSQMRSNHLEGGLFFKWNKFIGRWLMISANVNIQMEYRYLPKIWQRNHWKCSESVL